MQILELHESNAFHYLSQGQADSITQGWMVGVERTLFDCLTLTLDTAGPNRKLPIGPNCWYYAAQKVTLKFIFSTRCT